MIIFKKADAVNSFLEAQRNSGKRYGFVPTMGALHAGHLSLIEAAKLQNVFVVCSIFVNPTQFNDPKDFEKYPKTIEKDIQMLESAGTDIVFIPSVNEIYPDGTKKKKSFALGHLEHILEGKFRPGHFQGVCTVMDRLIDIIPADNLYMGRKDYQQCMVVQRLLVLKNSHTVLHTCPTQREDDGLAMSSRNMRLSTDERKDAPAIFRTLSYLKDNLVKGPLDSLKRSAAESLKSNNFRVDYVEIADATTLETVDKWDGKQKLVALVAAFQNEIRLIDNLALN